MLHYTTKWSDRLGQRNYCKLRVETFIELYINLIILCDTLKCGTHKIHIFFYCSLNNFSLQVVFYEKRHSLDVFHLKPLYTSAGLWRLKEQLCAAFSFLLQFLRNACCVFIFPFSLTTNIDAWRQLSSAVKWTMPAGTDEQTPGILPRLNLSFVG